MDGLHSKHTFYHPCVTYNAYRNTPDQLTSSQYSGRPTPIARSIGRSPVNTTLPVWMILRDIKWEAFQIWNSNLPVPISPPTHFIKLSVHSSNCCMVTFEDGTWFRWSLHFPLEKPCPQIYRSHLHSIFLDSTISTSFSPHCVWKFG